MGRICQSCHARIDDGMKICPNCGRIVPSERKEYDAAGRQPAPKRVYEHPKRQAAQPCAAKISSEERREHRQGGHSEKDAGRKAPS